MYYFSLHPIYTGVQEFIEYHKEIGTVDPRIYWMVQKGILHLHFLKRNTFFFFLIPESIGKDKFYAMVESESDKPGLEFHYTSYYLDIFNS